MLKSSCVGIKPVKAAPRAKPQIAIGGFGDRQKFLVTRPLHIRTVVHESLEVSTRTIEAIQAIQCANPETIPLIFVHEIDKVAAQTGRIICICQ